MEPKPNIVVIMSDTLRLDYIGCYGNTEIKTPNIDALAKESMRFTNAFPESLPTIPVRRALHTGRRAYPFRNYRPVKWDIVHLPGWEPIDNEEDTLAENLTKLGYQTGLGTDSLPYFAPGFNFTRGFWQWEFIRGQQQDRWRSPYRIPPQLLARYGDLDELRKDLHGIIPMHVANTMDVKNEEDTTTAKTFKWGMQFLEDNVNGQPFYLMIDCFDPHEPWEPPGKYKRMYADPNYSGRHIVTFYYGPATRYNYTPEEVRYVKSQYSGLVTLVDTWLGRFLKKLDSLGLVENTAIFFISDHGTNFGGNPREIVGKPSYSMYPAVMRLPLLVRLPDGQGAGGSCDKLVYDTDVVATIYDLVRLQPPQRIDGMSLLPLLTKRGHWTPREYITCRYGDNLCYIDEDHWILTNIDRQQREIFDLRSDPGCRYNLEDEAETGIFTKAWTRLLEDAGGNFPDYRIGTRTDAIGRKISH